MRSRQYTSGLSSRLEHVAKGERLAARTDRGSAISFDIEATVL
jgi:hypothetical protein